MRSSSSPIPCPISFSKISSHLLLRLQLQKSENGATNKRRKTNHMKPIMIASNPKKPPTEPPTIAPMLVVFPGESPPLRSPGDGVEYGVVVTVEMMTDGLPLGSVVVVDVVPTVGVPGRGHWE